jgi:hypothetical protein
MPPGALEPPVFREIAQQLPELARGLRGFADGPRLGSYRFSVVLLLERLLAARRPEVCGAVLQAGCLPTVVDMFFFFKFNNMLHNAVLRMVLGIVNGATGCGARRPAGPTADTPAARHARAGVAEGSNRWPRSVRSEHAGSQPYLQCLLGCGLLRRVMAEFRAGSAEVDFMGRGYMGHLKYMAVALAALPLDLLEAAGPPGQAVDVLHDWREFVGPAGTLRAEVRKDTVGVAGLAVS